MQKVKEFLTKIIGGFKNLDKSKKIAICIGVVAIVASIALGVNYKQQNKYGVLYSGLESTDSAAVIKALEDAGVDTKIDGDTIYVPKEQVDKLRIQLASTITNGSKGFELMDEGSNLSMTDEEFQIKKLRMIQGEIEKTIKTFPQVEDTRVHITQGKESVFSTETTEGKAAVYVSLKPGQELDRSQIKSIMSLVSASTTNIPKKNVEVIDQRMNLLSEGIYDEDGNSINNKEAISSRSAEKQVSGDLQKSILDMLEGVFGKDKVKVTVNAVLDYDTVEKNELVINPDKVIKTESRSQNSSLSENSTGSPVDNNMTTTSSPNNDKSSSSEEKIEYELGKTETKTFSSGGQIKKLTVSSALGIDNARGDQLSVVAMPFNTDGQSIFENNDDTNKTQKNEGFLKYGLMTGGIALAIIAVVAVLLFMKKKSTKEEIEEVEETQEDLIAKLVKEKEAKIEREIAMEESEISLEDEIKLIVSKNTDETTELIKTWLNE